MPTLWVFWSIVCRCWKVSIIGLRGVYFYVVKLILGLSREESICL